MARGRTTFLASLRAAFLPGVLVLVLGAAEAQATVNVQFVNPAGYTDSVFRNGAGSLSPRIVMDEVGRILRRLGDRTLSPGQVLSVEILDVQLAGYINWWSFPSNEIRIASNAGPPPRFRLRYTLKARGKLLAASEETITDIDFLINPSARLSTDPLVYEKALLDKWFRERFAPR